MLDPVAMFADLARAVSAVCGGPFFAGTIVTQVDIEYDTGGDVIPGSGGTLERGCDVQIDRADYAMRQAQGWVEGTMACIIPVGSLVGILDTDAVVTIDGGPFAGTTWNVSSIGRDTAGTHWFGKAVEA